MKIHSNLPLKWIMKNALLQHGSKSTSFWLFKKVDKTCAILIICSKRPQNDVIEIFKIFNTFINYCQMASEGSCGAPGDLAGCLRQYRQASKPVSMNSKSCKIHWIPRYSMNSIAFHGILWISLHSIGFYGFHWIPHDSMHSIGFYAKFL